MNINIKARLNAYSKGVLPNNITTDDTSLANNNYVRKVDTQYILLTIKPVDWDTSKTSYFKLVDGEYVPVVSTDVWATSTYYRNGKVFSWLLLSEANASDTNITTINNSIANANTNILNLQTRTTDLENSISNINSELNTVDGVLNRLTNQSASLNSMLNSTLNSTLNSKLNTVTTSNDFAGNGTTSSPLQLNISTDNATIQKDNNAYTVIGIKNGSSTITATTINEISTNVDNEKNRNDAQDLRLTNLENKVKGMGGYLPSNNFGSKITQNALTNYAKTILGLTDETQIPNQTRVKNTNDNHLWILNNKQDTTPTVFQWIDNGTDTVNIATTNVLGVVKGSIDDYEGSVDANGIITINGLGETEINAITNRISALENNADKRVKFLTYSNTTLSAHFSDILSYINNRSIAFIELKLSSNLIGDVVELTQTSGGNTMSATTGTLLNSNTYYYAYPKMITSTNGYFTFGNNTLFIDGSNAKLSGEVMSFDDTSITKQLFKDVDIKTITLNTLVIAYYD